MSGFGEIRARFEAARQKTKTQKVADKPVQDTCIHDFKKHRQTIHATDRTKRQSLMGMDYAFGRAYFIVKICSNCNEKRYLDYVIEK